MRRFLQRHIKSEEFIVLVVLMVIALGAYGVSQSGILAAGDSSGDLVAHYRFDEGAGQTVYDYSNERNEGTLGIDDAGRSDDPQWNMSCRQSGCLWFDGSNDYVNITGHVTTANTVTLSAWVKTGASDSSHHDVVAIGDVVILRGMDSGYSGKANGVYYDGSSWHYTPAEKINDSKWHHVAFVLDGNGNEQTVYIDGEAAGTSTDTADPDFSAAFSPDTTIGRAAAGVSKHWNGTIDDVRIYDTALNQSDIKALYNHGSSMRTGTEPSSPEGKVLDIGFDKINDTHVFDTSGKTNHGKPQNGATQQGAVHCKVGRCYGFDGEEDYIDIADDDSLDVQAGDWTVMAWVKHDVSRQEAIVSKKNSFWFYLQEGDNAFAIGQGGDLGWAAIGSNNPVPVGEWHHVAFTQNSTNHTTLYLDGTFDRQDSIDLKPSDNPVNIGRWNDGNRNFTGEIDQVKVFGRELSQQEIIEEAGIDRDGAVLDLRFDGGAGDTAYDQSMYSSDGTLQPNETDGPQWVDGVQGKALRFTDDGSNVSLPEDASIPSGSDPFTISTWIKTTETSTCTAGIFGYGNYGNTEQVNALRTDSCNRLRHYFWSNDLVTGDININDGRWHHVVVTYDGQDRAIYKDGEQVAADAPGNVNMQVQDVAVGVTNNNEEFIGTIDNVKLYPYAVSDDTVKELYRRGSSRIGAKTSKSKPPQAPNNEDLVLHHTFDKVNSTHSLDWSSFKNHGTPENGPVQKGAVHCKVGRCYEFDDSDDRVAVPDDDTLDNMSELTVMAWEKSTGTSDWQNRIVSKWGSQEKDYQIFLGGNDYGSDGNADQAACEIRTEGGTISFDADTAAGTIRGDNTWHHVACTYNGSHAHLYVDGTEQNSVAEGGGRVNDSNAELWVGESKGEFQSFEGPIDDVRIYNRSLSEEEVWHMYSEGRDRLESTKMAGPVGHWRMDAGPRTCLLNTDRFNDGGWGAPTSAELKSTLESEGWSPRYVEVDDITEDGWKQCDVIVFPHGEDYPAFDTSADYCDSVNGEGGEHDVFAEMKEFVEDGGIWVGSWGAGMYYPFAHNASGWYNYETECSQYSGDTLYASGWDGNSERCSTLGFSCYNSGSYNYTNIDQSVAPALPETITGVAESNRWASNLDINYLQAYNGSPVDSRYAGLSQVGDGWYFYMGANRLFDSSEHTNASDAWNNLLTWYAGNGGQNIWDASREANTGNITGDNNAPAFSWGCQTGTCMAFDGSNDYVNMEDTVEPSGSFSILLWLKNRDFSTSWLRYIDKTTASGDFAHGYRILNDDSNMGNTAPIVANIGNGTVGENLDLISSTLFEEDRWLHVALTYNDTRTHATLWVNGRKEDDGGVIASVPSTANLNLGRSPQDTGYFNGTLDDVRVYPYALTKEQVKQVMRQGAARIG